MTPAVQNAVRRVGSGPFAVSLALFALASCRNASDYRREADETADAYLSAYQQKAVGRTEKIEVETPEDTLRRMNITVGGGKREKHRRKAD